ncbi:MAG: inorganic phosphate transporter [Candidatus Woesearchaeota archaeon]|jgi:PiT family inorganic phosphate transporter|nr:inorganic phosphate transporter [Candidatus Woesearchaeota archaeon]MDP7622505.1 inorganic phosphate transporter [Candidatus Woesearchaeota archaeon]HJN56597.1 inorganic phosphate transporter [Candidatus Woesearchaeota archaeon]|tara:strand:- start:36594 stop:37592 length:999 start_codon:yes stop_codon:yes gene_type:complete
MPEIFTLVVITVIVALIFDFGNGLNDAANAIATVVATRALPLWGAVLLAAVGNFAGVFIFGVAVATTVAKGLVDPSIVNVYVILGGLTGAILWVYFATYYGIPVSASHSLIGGFVGAALVAAGLSSLKLMGISKVLIFIIVAPLLGMIGGFLFFAVIMWMFRKTKPQKVNKWFKKLQLITASTYSITHGANDAQKTMGLIAILLFSSGHLKGEFFVPYWVIITSYTVIALGTLAGGWRVIKTIGIKLTKIRPVHGFCASGAGSVVLAFTSIAGIPVSTTHVMAGSIMGVGSVRRFSAVRWKLARGMVWAWILTIPAAAIVSGVSYFVISLVI